jgi:hypothetical protein
MVHYCLFSRRTGYVGGIPTKHFCSVNIEDKNHDTIGLIDKSSEEILHILNNTDKYDVILADKLKKICQLFPNWYYYPVTTIITDTRVYL